MPFRVPAMLNGVYPRECGGTKPTCRFRSGVLGLSPRVRGNRVGVVGSAEGARSIPASAGEPSTVRRTASSSRVYPRECGGTSHRRWQSPPLSGLSPRVRGNQGAARGGGAGQGSIPASAGEPRSWSSARLPGRVYPRECGGTRAWPQPTAAPWGLSPRVRGNHRRHQRTRMLDGSIPASAGEPGSRRSPGEASTVYPRECGGTPTTARMAGLMWGLSPRVRGNRAASPCPNCSGGSIPASAGEPTGCGCRSSSGRVYPRECGGTRVWTASSMSSMGLSPRVRGNPTNWGTFGRRSGSIPASAGEPRRGRSRQWVCQVYPRECGGTISPTTPKHLKVGLSPRVRGNPFLRS